MYSDWEDVTSSGRAFQGFVLLHVAVATVAIVASSAWCHVTAHLALAPVVISNQVSSFYFGFLCTRNAAMVTSDL